MIGRKLSHYQIIAPLGAGGMGVVYRAHDEQLDRDVALKVLPAGLLSDEVARNRFRKEALAIAKLNHPNIATVYEFGSDEGVDFLAMELIAGETLSARIARGFLTVGEAERFGAQLAEGLAAAHAQGVIHRDLKPGNLMLTADSRLKILDFGLARLLEPGDKPDVSRTLSETSAVSGTLPYMSPEQVKGLPADARSDIFAAGAVLYEMATGRRPFPQLQSAEVIGAILHQDPPAASLVNRRITPGLATTIGKCLEKEPQKRFQSARELLAALESASAGTLPGIPRGPLAVPAAAVLGVLLLAGILLGVNFGGWRDRFFHRSDSEKAGFGSGSGPIHARRSVAVLGFKNLSGKIEAAWLSTAFSEMLTTELAAGEKLRTIPGENVARMKNDLALADADSYGKDTLAKIRTVLGNDLVVQGSYLVTGKAAVSQIRLDLNVQDASAGETVAALSETGSEADVLNLVSRAGEHLRNKLGVGSVSGKDEARVQASLPTNPEVARLYAEGITKLRVFDALAARALLEKAVAAGPNYALAHAALAEAWSNLGYDPKAQMEAQKAFELSTELSREQRLAIEGGYREITHEWNKATGIYHTLWAFFPDNLEYGLHLAETQTAAGKGKDALLTVEELRKLPAPAPEDPRIDLAEGAAAGALGDFKRQQGATERAASKSAEAGQRLLMARARLSLGHALYGLGDFEKSIAASEEAQKIYSSSGDLSGAAQAMNNMASAISHIGQVSAAKKMHEHAVETCRKIGNQKCTANSLNNLAIMFKDQGDLATALKLQEETIAIRREIGDKNGLGTSVSNVGVTLFEQGDYAGAKKKYDEALAISREIGDRRNMVRAMLNYAIVLTREGDLAGARKMHEESLAIRREMGDRAGTGTALINLSEVLLNQGELAAAKARDQEALTIERQLNNKRGLAYALSMFAEISMAEDQLAEAEKSNVEALGIRNALGEQETAQESRLNLALGALEQGRTAEAEATTRVVADEATKIKLNDIEATAEAIRAQCHLTQGKTAEAQRDINQAAAVCGKSQSRNVQLFVAITQGRVSAATGHAAAAAATLEKALADAGHRGLFTFQLDARLALGEMEMKSGKAEAGRARLAALEKEATSKGFLLIARKAKAAADGKQAAVANP